MYFEGELPVMTSGNCNNNGWNDWSWIIGLALVGGLFGNGGFGFGGGNRGGACATQADLAAGFNNSAVLSSLNDIKLGQSQMQNFINQGFSGVNTSLLQGNYALSTQLADCCCRTQGAIADVKYANERNTCDIIAAINAGNQRLVDIYTNDKIEALRAENTALKGRISDDYQADRIISRLNPTPSPAYIVPNPNCCYNYNVTQGCGCNGGF